MTPLMAQLQELERNGWEPAVDHGRPTARKGRHVVTVTSWDALLVACHTIDDVDKEQA